MVKGTRKSMVTKIVTVVLIAGTGLGISACDNKNTPSTPGTPHNNAPTFTPAPLASKRPTPEPPRTVNNDSPASDDAEIDSYPAPAPVITSDANTVSG